MPYDSPGTSFLMPKISAKLEWYHPNRGAKWRWGRLNAGVVARNCWLLTRTFVNLVQLQFYHTERPHYLFLAHLLWCSVSHRFDSDSWFLFSNLLACSCHTDASLQMLILVVFSSGWQCIALWLWVKPWNQCCCWCFTSVYADMWPLHEFVSTASVNVSAELHLTY